MAAVSYTHLDVYKRQADAYDGVHAVAEALKEAGLGVDADPTEAAEKLSKAMLLSLIHI